MGYEFIDHTSEITLRVESPTFEGLLVDATRGLAGLVPADLKRAVAVERRDFRVRARDRIATLVEWLNEIVYLSEAEQWLPVDIESTREDEAGLLVRAEGVPLEEPWVLVKAATLHRASIIQEAGGLVAEVTLDV